jgi:hypothetical protein
MNVIVVGLSVIVLFPFLLGIIGVVVGRFTNRVNVGKANERRVVSLENVHYATANWQPETRIAIDPSRRLTSAESAVAQQMFLKYMILLEEERLIRSVHELPCSLPEIKMYFWQHVAGMAQHQHVLSPSEVNSLGVAYQWLANFIDVSTERARELDAENRNPHRKEPLSVDVMRWHSDSLEKSHELNREFERQIQKYPARLRQ